MALMPSFALQIDPPAQLNPASDTSIALGLEGIRRGLSCYFFRPRDLSWHNGTLTARAQPLSLRESSTDWFTLGAAQTIETASLDVIWMRQDPPFNMEYITTTHLLEHAGCRVVNDPIAVRNTPEKLAALHFSQYMPPTLVSENESAIAAFAREHGTVVAKPLHGYGGRSIFKFAHTDGNLPTFLEFWREHYAEPLQWQAFLPQVKDADRRIILINGELRSCFGRIPESGSIRANMRVGGEAVKAEPTPRQLEIAGVIGDYAKKNGLLIVGLDVIGDYLTELNVTSPTGFRAAQRLYGTDLARDAWDALEAL